MSNNEELRRKIKEEYQKCATDRAYFIRRHVKIQHPIQGTIPFNMHDYQEKCLNSFVENQNNIVLKGRQIGLSTLVSAYSLHEMIFKSGSNIVVIATKLATAKNLISKIRFAYKKLPVYLQEPCVEDNKLSLVFRNGSRIIATTSAGDSARSEAASILIIDECAFIDNIEEIWTSAQPTLSTGGKSIVISCVTPETIVFTNRGPQRIDTIIPSELGAHEVSKYGVLGKDRLRYGKYVLNSGEVETKKITTTHAILEGSNKHKVWAYSGGDYRWTRMDNLSVGDYVAIQYGMNLWGNENATNWFYTPSSKEHNIFECDYITTDVAYFMGLYISEGSVYKRRNKFGKCVGATVTISCGDSIAQAISAIGLTYSSHDNLHYSVGSLSLVTFLEHMGFDLTKRAPRKIIPERLLRMSKENIIALLQGIFDGDGSSRKDRGSVSIGLSSKELINQIRVLLNNFGILCEYSERMVNPTQKVKTSSYIYRLQTSSAEDSIRFYNEIGFRFNRKQENMRNIIGKRDTNSYDIIPTGVEIVNHLFNYYDNTMASLKHNHGLVLNGVLNTCTEYKTKRINRANALQMLEITSNNISNDVLELVDEILSPNIRWSPIRKIESGKNVVMDVSLPDNEDDFWAHSVIYNGILGHQTPCGQGNFFHKTWTAAVNGENDFNFIKLDWRVVPGRTDEWRQAQSKAIGDERLASQEHDAEFIGSGNTVIDEYITKWYEDTYVKEPIGTAGFDDNLWVWEHPNYTKKYILCADVARGDATDYSAFHVLDAESCTQVAEYKGKLSPQLFAHLIISTATSYNDAVVVIDNSTIGHAVIQVLLEREYKNLFWMTKDLQYVDPDDDFLKKYYKGEKNSVPGFTISHRTRPLIVSKLVDYFGDKSVIIRSSRTCAELYTFIWNNGKPESVRGTNDDLVIALAMGLWIRDTALVVHELSSEMTKATITGIRLNRSHNPELAHLNNTTTGVPRGTQNPFIFKTSHGGGGFQHTQENIMDLRELLR